MRLRVLIRFNIPIILATVVLVLLISLLLLDSGSDSLSKDMPDRCLSCHQDVNSMSLAHGVEALGCAVCHLGNALASAKEEAHRGMVKNPSDLQWANRTCGRSDCHPQWVQRVQKSIMTSNAGIVASTLYQWGETDSPDDSSAHIAQGLTDTSLATSHLRKMCAGCHINKLRGDLPGEFGLRGGGCNDCHLVDIDPESMDSLSHPLLSVLLDIPVCEKCHNRSDRTALSYQGKYESEGYGTPFEGGNLCSQRLSGARYYYHLPADVHFRAGMVCIDCHPAEDLMGNGRRYAHAEEQVHVKCKSCHMAVMARPQKKHQVWRLIKANPMLQIPGDSMLAMVDVDSDIFLSNIFSKGDYIYWRSKLNGQILRIRQVTSRLECNFPGHERLSCQACHSPYSPQCFGCHDTFNPAKKQLDKISYRESEGRWREGRSYLRFEEPALGLDGEGRIVPFAPGCQVYLNVLDGKGNISRQETFLTMAPFDPHSTQKEVPVCRACHLSPKRLGLGSGLLYLIDGELRFEPIYDVESAKLGRVALESMVDVNGRVLQKMSRKNARPFNASELRTIYRVGLCLSCHDSYYDTIYTNFEVSVERYFQDESLPCRR